MNTLDSLFQATVNKPQYQLVEEARAALGVVGNYLEMFTGKTQTAVYQLAAIGTFVAADGKVSYAEFEFMQSVLRSNLSYDAFFSAAESSAETNIVTNIDKIIDNAPQEVKTAFLSLCLSFIACDGTITPEEKSLFVRYLA